MYFKKDKVYELVYISIVSWANKLKPNAVALELRYVMQFSFS